MESQWTPKTSETDLRGQISMNCGVLYIIGKLLERRCLKWARIAHFEHLKHKLWPKEGAGSRTANLTPDQKKSGIDPIYLAADNGPHTLESSRQELQLCFRSHFDPRSARKVMGLRSPESPN